MPLPVERFHHGERLFHSQAGRFSVQGSMKALDTKRTVIDTAVGFAEQCPPLLHHKFSDCEHFAARHGHKGLQLSVMLACRVRLTLYDFVDHGKNPVEMANWVSHVPPVGDICLCFAHGEGTSAHSSHHVIDCP